MVFNPTFNNISVIAWLQLKMHLLNKCISLTDKRHQGRIQDFKLGGAHLKKLRREEGNCWGISCEKSRFYAKKSYFFQF
jgi:hypothetical protein